MVRFWAILGFGALVVTGCARFEPGAPPGQVDIIAHRGASAYAPENTLAAFELAVKQKAHWFELDCTLTKDEEVIVIHDDTLERTTNGLGAVADYTLAQLKRLDAGNWGEWEGSEFKGEPAPTLGEALDLAQNRIGVYIEIKNSDDDQELMQAVLQASDGGIITQGRSRDTIMGLIEESGTRNLPLTRNVIEAVRARDMRRQVVIQSFSPIVCAIALSEAPELRTELLGAKDEDHPERWEGYLFWNQILGAQGFNVNQAALTPENLDTFHGMGKTVAVWTVDDPAEMRRLAVWGVDGLITNKPDVARDVLESLNQVE